MNCSVTFSAFSLICSLDLIQEKKADYEDSCRQSFSTDDGGGNALIHQNSFDSAFSSKSIDEYLSPRLVEFRSSLILIERMDSS